MTPLERAAKAAYDEAERSGAYVGDYEFHAGKTTCIDGNVDIKAMVRAALSSLMEPSPEMVTASRQALGKHIRSLPAAEREATVGKEGGFRLHDESLKATIRWAAMLTEAMK